MKKIVALILMMFILGGCSSNKEFDFNNLKKLQEDSIELENDENNNEQQKVISCKYTMQDNDESTELLLYIEDEKVVKIKLNLLYPGGDNPEIIVKEFNDFFEGNEEIEISSKIMGDNIEFNVTLDVTNLENLDDEYLNIFGIEKEFLNDLSIYTVISRYGNIGYECD